MYPDAEGKGWGREFLRPILEASPDQALRDAVLTHGVVYLADLQPQVVLQDHLQSLVHGFSSVHSEVKRLVKGSSKAGQHHT